MTPLRLTAWRGLRHFAAWRPGVNQTTLDSSGATFAPIRRFDRFALCVCEGPERRKPGLAAGLFDNLGNGDFGSPRMSQLRASPIPKMPSTKNRFGGDGEALPIVQPRQQGRPKRGKADHEDDF